MTASLPEEEIAEMRTSYGETCESHEWDQPQHCQCKEGESLSQLKSTHDNHKEDRKWNLGCQKIDGYISANTYNFAKYKLSNSWDNPQHWDGQSAGNYLIGMKSYHNNRKEDRLYTMIYAAKPANWKFLQCSGWKAINNWDGRMDTTMRQNEVVVGMKSTHSNRKEDRVFQIKTCLLRRKCNQVVNIVYGKKISQPSDDIEAASKTQNNLGSDTPSKLTVAISQSKQEELSDSYSFEKTESTDTEMSSSATINIGNEKSFYSASITAGLSHTISKSSTVSRSETKTYSTSNGRVVTSEAVCPARMKCKTELRVAQTKFKIPYTMKMQAKGDSEICTEKGFLHVTESQDINKVTVTCKVGESCAF